MNRPVIIPAWLAVAILLLSGGGVTAEIAITPGAPTAVPSGGIIAIDSGSCPSGFTEVTAARGRVPRGTPAAGTLGGTVGTALTDLQVVTITPTTTWPTGVPTVTWPGGTPAFSGTTLATHTHGFTGDVLATHTHGFTGSALATHQHNVPMNSNGRLGMAYGSGAAFTPDNIATITADTVSTSSALTSATSGGTPAGTNASVSAGTPSGTNASVTAGTPSGTNAWPAAVPTTAWPSAVPTVSTVTTSDAAIQFTYCKSN